MNVRVFLQGWFSAAPWLSASEASTMVARGVQQGFEDDLMQQSVYDKQLASSVPLDGAFEDH